MQECGLKREYLSLAKASKVLRVGVDDLLHAGAIGTLQLCIKTARAVHDDASLNYWRIAEEPKRTDEIFFQMEEIKEGADAGQLPIDMSEKCLVSDAQEAYVQWVARKKERLPDGLAVVPKRFLSHLESDMHAPVLLDRLFQNLSDNTGLIYIVERPKLLSIDDLVISTAEMSRVGAQVELDESTDIEPSANATVDSAVHTAQEVVHMQEAITHAVMTAKDGFVNTAEAAEWLTGFPKKSSDGAVALGAYLRGISLISAELNKRHGQGNRPDCEDNRGFSVPGSGGQVSIYLVRDIARTEGNALLVKFLNELIAQREAVLGVSNKAEVKSNYIPRSVVHLNNLKVALTELGIEPDNLQFGNPGGRRPEKRAAREKCVPSVMTAENFGAAWKALNTENKERNASVKGAPAGAYSTPGILIP